MRHPALQNGLPEEKKPKRFGMRLHYTPRSALHRKAPEIALVHLGATMTWADGTREPRSETVERVIEVYPRVGCGQALLKLIISQVKRKPKSAAFTWMAEDGGCHIHGFACPHLSKSF